MMIVILIIAFVILNSMRENKIPKKKKLKISWKKNRKCTAKG